MNFETILNLFELKLIRNGKRSNGLLGQLRPTATVRLAREAG
jgi:hypothetical protein